jgi:hypothetical protein
MAEALEALSAGEACDRKIDRSVPDTALIARIDRRKMTISPNATPSIYFAMPAQIPIELFFGCCETANGPDVIWGISARQPTAA